MHGLDCIVLFKVYFIKVNLYKWNDAFHLWWPGFQKQTNNKSSHSSEKVSQEI